MLTKRYKKYLNYAINRYTHALEVVEGEYDRLVKVGYKDIRQVVGPMQYIEDVTVDGNDGKSITVVFCFGTVEQSPVDGFGFKQILEIIRFLKNQLSYFEAQLIYNDD